MQKICTDGKGRDGADEEGNHVGDGGDGDGNCRVSKSVGQALGHRVLQARPPPGRQHHESVVNADT